MVAESRLGIVESLRQALAEPQELVYVEELQNRQNALVRSFMVGELDVDTFRRQLLEINEESLGQTTTFSLDYPGPLYGILRRLGADQNTAQSIAEEERAHYSEAIRQGLQARIKIVVAKGNASRLSCYVSYQVPEDIETDDLREKIKAVTLAPAEPSEDDLAKLPGSVV